MKQSLLAGVSLSAMTLAMGAQAADLGVRSAYKVPVLTPAPWNWTGFYVGGNVGIAYARTTISNPNDSWSLPGTTFDSGKTGFIGGLQAGYNWQVNDVVFGIEGDVSFGSLSRSTVPPAGTFGINGDTFTGQMNVLGTVRGRLGLAFDRALVYGTGGVAFASLKDEYSSPFPFTATANSSAIGWAAGGGVEYALTGHWSAKAEYLHVGFSSRSATVAPFPSAPYTFAFKDSLDIGRVGINYKF